MDLPPLRLATAPGPRAAYAFRWPLGPSYLLILLLISSQLTCLSAFQLLKEPSSPILYYIEGKREGRHVFLSYLEAIDFLFATRYRAIEALLYAPHALRLLLLAASAAATLRLLPALASRAALPRANAFQCGKCAPLEAMALREPFRGDVRDLGLKSMDTA